MVLQQRTWTSITYTLSESLPHIRDEFGQFNLAPNGKSVALDILQDQHGGWLLILLRQAIGSLFLHDPTGQGVAIVLLYLLLPLLRRTLPGVVLTILHLLLLAEGISRAPSNLRPTDLSF